MTDTECKDYVFRTCRLIAQNSDPGRKALIDAGILPHLSILASSQIPLEVVSACQILKALAHTGTFRQNIISAGLKASMEHITRLAPFLANPTSAWLMMIHCSPIRRSTLRFKEDKILAQAAAKEVLETLKASKYDMVSFFWSRSNRPTGGTALRRFCTLKLHSGVLVEAILMIHTSNNVPTDIL